MYEIRILNDALDDLQEFINYYDDLSTAITDKLLIEFEIISNYLIQNPYLFQERYKKTRIVFFKKFPIGVHFRIMDNNVEIIAFFHTSKNPKKWFKHKK